MEKLIELLNEYTNKHSLCIRMSEPYKGVYLQYDENFTVDIISKQFGFIKWLVDNDKINIEEIQYFGTDDMKEAYSIEENLLMLLAIQDNPTEFLISVLN